VKRLAMVSMLALVCAAVALAPGAAGSGDAAGPPCSDITFGDGGYVYSNQTQPYFDFHITLAAPACSFVTYTLYVSLDGDTAYPVYPVQPVSGTTVTFARQTFTDQTTAPTQICVYATTSIKGHVADRAPDSPAVGCFARDEGAGTLFH
jgi:hypothetical protein